MKSYIYVLRFNFSDSVYVGYTQSIKTRIEQHKLRIKKLNKAIKTDERPFNEIGGTQKTTAWPPHENHIPIKMYLDALFFWRDERKDVSFRVEIAHEIECICKNHDRGNVCYRVKKMEMDKILSMDTYNVSVKLFKSIELIDTCLLSLGCFNYFGFVERNYTPIRYKNGNINYSESIYTNGSISVNCTRKGKVETYSINGQQLKTVGDLRQHTAI